MEPIASDTYRTASKDQICEGCNKRPEEGRSHQLCSGCRAAMFCSKECLAQVWKYHKTSCLKFQAQNELEELGKPSVRAKQNRRFSEFWTTHRDTFVDAIDMAILGEIVGIEVPNGSSFPEHNFNIIDASNYVAYFQLSDRAQGGDPSRTYEVKQGTLTTWAVFEKDPILSAIYDLEDVARWRQESQARIQQLRESGKYLEDIGMATIMIRVLSPSGDPDLNQTVRLGKMVYKRDVKALLTELQALKVSPSSEWLDNLLMYVDSGVSRRWFEREGMRTSVCGHMVKVVGEPGSKSRWKWLELSREEAVALIKKRFGHPVTRGSSRSS
ncbi:uncharacterized protein STEHIDRAFT_165986 [Stereum hirsutum FP-91666 SS1]|uniref:uncharacterized protein n=1 Tax=Stereum hirsutum (strain FP-91666) TaxID=721885 RepID=UPI000440C37D|nr:uncharacterized protein STEHIDRAFT_165986 [Stereum hirsutum FP-91666 SS1]EIM89611.1 hypothetical protein STEHIDRAFT_165986 [Stereum hirsutum FP-91666 SS1]